jgi:hypothetical protein
MTDLQYTNAFLEKVIDYNEKHKILVSLISFDKGAGYINIMELMNDDKELIIKTTTEELYKFNEKDSNIIKSKMKLKMN